MALGLGAPCDSAGNSPARGSVGSGGAVGVPLPVPLRLLHVVVAVIRQSHHLTLFSVRHLCSWFLQHCGRQEGLYYTWEVVTTGDAAAVLSNLFQVLQGSLQAPVAAVPGCSYG